MEGRAWCWRRVFTFASFWQLEEEEHALREAMSGFAALQQSRDELQELMAVLTTADEMLSVSKQEAALQPLGPDVLEGRARAGGSGGSGGVGKAATAVAAAAGRREAKRRGGGLGAEALDQPLLAAAAAEEGRAGGGEALGGTAGALTFVTGVIEERGR